MITRRDLLRGVTGTAGLLAWPSRQASGEPAPETTRVRLYKFPGLCLAPQYVAEDLLRAEGFTDVQYLDFPEGAVGVYERVGSSAVDFTQWYGVPFIQEIDKGQPIVVLAGVHIGCTELFATERIRAFRDLKGKTVAVAVGSPAQSILPAMLAHVGLDHRKDLTFANHSPAESVRLLAEGKIDGFLATPPWGQELRARKIGHVIVNTTVDRPWSQYFCCMFIGNTEYVRKNPVATKRVLRAILKADEVCALEPERVARTMVDRGFTTNYGHALQTLKEVPYGKWRQYNPEDTVRFYALRLREAGLIKLTPQRILADGTDWRFLNELKKELKG